MPAAGSARNAGNDATDIRGIIPNAGNANTLLKDDIPSEGNTNTVVRVAIPSVGDSAAFVRVVDPNAGNANTAVRVIIPSLKKECANGIGNFPNPRRNHLPAARASSTSPFRLTHVRGMSRIPPMKHLHGILYLLVALTSGSVAAEPQKVAQLSGVFASPYAPEGGTAFELKDGRFTCRSGGDVGLPDTGTGLEHQPQTGSYIFDGYRLVLLGDTPLYVSVYYRVVIERVELLLDRDAAYEYHRFGKVGAGYIMIRIPAMNSDVALVGAKLGREHPNLHKLIRGFPLGPEGAGKSAIEKP